MTSVKLFGEGICLVFVSLFVEFLLHCDCSAWSKRELLRVQTKAVRSVLFLWPSLTRLDSRRRRGGTNRGKFEIEKSQRIEDLCSRDQEISDAASGTKLTHETYLNDSCEVETRFAVLDDHHRPTTPTTNLNINKHPYAISFRHRVSSFINRVVTSASLSESLVSLEEKNTDFIWLLFLRAKRKSLRHKRFGNE